MNNKKEKQRLDDILVFQGYCETKSKAQGAILAGKVKVGGKTIDKAGTKFDISKELDIEVASLPYVSRGGLKLAKAINKFNIDLTGKICLDAGASTGGFTDCILQNGAKKVYAVDVGYGQLAWKLRNDERVAVIERTNIRSATPDEIYKEDKIPAEFCSIDLSFISITKVLENIQRLMNPEKQEIIALVKPQFEAGREQVPKNGVIKDKKIHYEVIEKVAEFAASLGISPADISYSPVQGPAGNIEYLLYLKTGADYNKEIFYKVIEKTVEEAHENFSGS